MLVHILGAQQPAITAGLSKTTGLDAAQIEQLLQIAAPIIMGILGQQQQKAGLDPAGLTAFLGGQQQQVQQSNPDPIGVLNTTPDTALLFGRTVESMSWV